MSKRAVLSFSAVAVLLLSRSASGTLTGTIGDGVFSDPFPTCTPPVLCSIVGNTLS